MGINKKYLAGLIVVALLLFIGMLFSLFQSASQSPEGKIIASKDYQYEGVEFTDSIYIYTGSNVLFAGSGKILSDKQPIVTEIKYSSGTTLMHRKLAISSGTLVTERPDLFRIYLASGAVIYDALTDDGDAGLFKSIFKKGLIKIISNGKILLSGEGEWDYVEGDTEKIGINFIEKTDEGKTIQRRVVLLAEDLNANDSGDIKIHLLTGSEVTEVEVVEIEEEETVTSFKDEPVNNKPKQPIKEDPAPEPEPEEDPAPEPEPEEDPVPEPEPEEDPVPEPEPEEDPAPEPEPEEENQGSLYWGEYPDTDEGNYDLATDKLNPNYCDRIDNAILRLTCKEVIYEALGKCELLEDISKHEVCENAHTKSIAVASDRISKCSEIQNDDGFKNSCINEINQNLYDAAIEAGDPNICKAIYNSGMLNACLAELGAE